MRPPILDPLFAPVTSLPGIGPKLEPLFDRLLADNGQPARMVDLLFHLPHAAIDRRPSGSIADAPIGTTATFAARVVEHRPPPPERARAPYKVLVEDESGDVTLVFFNAKGPRLTQSLPVEEIRYISGKLELWDGMRQMVHPERIMDARTFAATPSIEPVYGMTEGLTPRVVARARM